MEEMKTLMNSMINQREECLTNHTHDTKKKFKGDLICKQCFDNVKELNKDTEWKLKIRLLSCMQTKLGRSNIIEYIQEILNMQDVVRNRGYSIYPFFLFVF